MSDTISGIGTSLGEAQELIAAFLSGAEQSQAALEADLKGLYNMESAIDGVCTQMQKGLEQAQVNLDQSSKLVIQSGEAFKLAATQLEKEVQEGQSTLRADGQLTSEFMHGLRESAQQGTPTVERASQDLSLSLSQYGEKAKVVADGLTSLAAQSAQNLTEKQQGLKATEAFHQQGLDQTLKSVDQLAHYYQTELLPPAVVALRALQHWLEQSLSPPIEGEVHKSRDQLRQVLRQLQQSSDHLAENVEKSTTKAFQQLLAAAQGTTPAHLEQETEHGLAQFQALRKLTQSILHQVESIKPSAAKVYTTFPTIHGALSKFKLLNHL